MPRHIVLALLMMASSLSAQAPKQPCQDIPNRLRYVAYLASKPQDSPECVMKVENGRIVVGGPVTNAAMTCPDMFAWRLFAEVVETEFWETWAGDEYTWPTVQPYPLCGPGVDPRKCCNPDSSSNPGYDHKDNPAQFCPYFPGDHMARHADGPQRLGAPASKAHLPAFVQSSELRNAAARVQREDPGRVIRQSMAELVFRNKEMFDYIFRNNLYNQEGIAAVFKNHSANLTSGAPYRRKSQPGALVEIDLPVFSMMLKTNWLNARRAAELGMREDPNNPFVKMDILSPVIDNDAEIFEAGEHWLVAFHISSKDTPNWFWATFEHVNNPGRCDYSGCNDSYGFASPDAVASGQFENYTMPNTTCDTLLLANWIYDPGKIYPSGPISPALRRILSDLHIGTRDQTSGNPSRHDRGWLSYRLKGTQVEFTDSMGQSTQLGNSVTEGGFMVGSSCITCHARASTNGNGTIPLPLGVFINETSELGYLQSARGVPDPDWYHQSAQPPTMLALQTDFVWGFLAALCLNPTCETACPNQPASCGAAASGPPPTPATHKSPRHSIRRKIRKHHH